MPARLTHERTGRYTRRVASPRHISSAVYAVFTVLATAFVVSSTYQITAAVFAAPPPVGASPAAMALPLACAEGVRRLAGAVDRGLAAAGGQADGDEAARRYRAARSPEWDATQHHELVQACTGIARGTDAVAAVTRFDRAAEGAIRRQTSELASVRRTVDSFIR